MFTPTPATTQPNNLLARLLAWVRNSPPLRYPELGLICLGVFVQLIGVGAIVPVRAIYARDHGATMAELGLMASSFLLGNFLFQLPGGWASDRWGRKPLLIFGIVTAGLISLLFLLNDHPWYFIVLRFVEGAAGGAIMPAANAYVIDAVPQKDRGAAFGWVGSATSAGFMLGPAIGGIMSDAWGYSAPFIFGGITSVLTAIYMWAKMENRKPGGRPIEHPASGEAEGSHPHLERVIPKRMFWPALVGALVLTIAGGVADGLFISIWTLWLDDLNASTSFIGMTFITFSLPLMILMPVTGRWADRYRWTPMIVIPSVLISTIYLTYGFTGNLLLILGLGLAEGTMVAIMGPALSAYIANLSPDNARGRLQGVISTTRTTAAFASSMLTALLYGINMGYPFFMLAGAQIFISVVGGLLVWRIESRTLRLNRERAAAIATAGTAATAGSLASGDAAK